MYNELGMIDEARVRELLDPFGIEPSSGQVAQLLVYLDLLMRWNSKINLTAICKPEECVTRHFGESLYLAAKVELEGSLLDIGSGCGFPGLALKIPFPKLAVTLLEPSAKKRAFLKEVARACDLTSVDVRPERIESYPLIAVSPTHSHGPGRFDAITVRAVGGLRALVPAAVSHLKQEGRIFMWITKRQAADLVESSGLIAWQDSWPIPLSTSREIWQGSPRSATAHR
ncbi:MAG TPA: 16S rRNA (guanine(527)-N(7))-methyltransferase RsmG [Terriglobia bacterium]|nr:16S rRNA (guanine(527)-N(7))-methyltransferase RsmG [Terriglobia bacterium]